MKRLLAGLLVFCAGGLVHAQKAHPQKTETPAFNRPKVAANARKTLLNAQIKKQVQDKPVQPMEQALAEAVQKSTDLQTARLELMNMIENVNQARYSYYPDFTIELAPTFYKRNTNNGVDASDTDLLAEASLNQHLPGNIDISVEAERSISTLGREVQEFTLSVSKELLRRDPVSRSLTLARLKLDLQEISKEQTRRNFIYEFKTSYYNYLQQWLLYLNSRVKFQDNRKLNTESQRKYKAGIIAQYQLLDYDRDFSEVELALAADRLNWQTARNRLLYLMQRPLTDDLQFLPIDDEKMTRRQWDPGSMLEAAMETSISIAQLNTALLSNEENLAYYRSQLLPSAALFGSSEYEIDDMASGTDRETTTHSVGLRIMLPLFQTRFANRSRVRSTRNLIEISTLELDERFRYYQRQIADDLMSLQNLNDRYELAKKQFHIAYADYELGKLRFENGTIGSWDMIRNKNNFFRSHRTCIQLQYQWLRKTAQMERDYPVREEAAIDE